MDGDLGISRRAASTRGSTVRWRRVERAAAGSPAPAGDQRVGARLPEPRQYSISARSTPRG
jgi:hypothetical protein